MAEAGGAHFNGENINSSGPDLLENLEPAEAENDINMDQVTKTESSEVKMTIPVDCDFMTCLACLTDGAILHGTCHYDDTYWLSKYSPGGTHRKQITQQVTSIIDLEIASGESTTRTLAAVCPDFDAEDYRESKIKFLDPNTLDLFSPDSVTMTPKQNVISLCALPGNFLAYAALEPTTTSVTIHFLDTTQLPPVTTQTIPAVEITLAQIIENVCLVQQEGVKCVAVLSGGTSNPWLTAFEVAGGNSEAREIWKVDANSLPRGEDSGQDTTEVSALCAIPAPPGGTERRLLVADSKGQRVLSLSLDSGDFLEEIPLPGGFTLGTPWGLAWNAAHGSQLIIQHEIDNEDEGQGQKVTVLDLICSPGSLAHVESNQSIDPTVQEVTSSTFPDLLEPVQIELT